MSANSNPNTGKTLDEGEDFEEKSIYEGTNADKGMLVKTIVAMANTRGGRIRLRQVTCSLAELDSAKLDDLLARFVEPRVRDVRSVHSPEGGCEIRVASSHSKPHILARVHTHRDAGGKDQNSFYAGQVLVRHGSKTEAANGEDIERMVKERMLDGRVPSKADVWIAALDKPVDNGPSTSDFLMRCAACFQLRDWASSRDLASLFSGISQPKVIDENGFDQSGALASPYLGELKRLQLLKPLSIGNTVVFTLNSDGHDMLRILQHREEERRSGSG